jgi:hypothetical protein
VSDRQEELAQALIRETCDDLREFLIEKNRSYGNSALDPIRIFSRADPLEQIAVRIDDKLSRLKNGHAYPGDDDVRDLAGYLVLRMVAERFRKEVGE